MSSRADANRKLEKLRDQLRRELAELRILRSETREAVKAITQLRRKRKQQLFGVSCRLGTSSFLASLGVRRPS